MKISFAFVITVTVFLIFWVERPHLKNKNKEKKTVIVLLLLGWFIAILLIYFPDMPGPTQLIDWIFKPLGRLLEE